MERTDKSRKVMVIILLFAVLFTAGCVQTQMPNQTVTEKTAQTTPAQEQLPPEFDDGLDAALQELEETR